MATQVFKTNEDAIHSVEILGVGLLGAGGKGGVPVEQAATFMSELQEKDKDGVVVLDEDGNPKPLTGQKLKDAAKEFADARGLRVVSLSDEKVEGLAQEMGGFPDRPPAHVVAAEAYQKIYGGVAAAEESVDVTVPASLDEPDEENEGGAS